jgi:hypothetical protein
VDQTAFTFEALDNQTVLVLGTDGNLWIEQEPFGNVPPPRQQIDDNVQAMQALNIKVVFVLKVDGSLWLESTPFMWFTRQQVDANVRAFQALDVNTVLALGSDGKLWLEQAPFGNVPPGRGRLTAMCDRSPQSM